MFKGKRFFPHDCHIGLSYAELLRNFTPYLIYRGVLKAAARSIKTIEKSGLEKAMLSMAHFHKERTFLQAWLAFKDFAEDRRKCNAAVAAALGGWRANMHCQNSEVSFRLLLDFVVG